MKLCFWSPQLLNIIFTYIFNFCRFTGHVTQDYQIESAFNYNSSKVISGSADGKIYFWDLITQKVDFTLIHTNGKVVQSLCTHPKSDIVISAAKSNIKVWSKEQVAPEIT